MATGRHPRVPPPVAGARDLLDRPEHPARSNVLEQVGDEVDLSGHEDLVAHPRSGPATVAPPAVDAGMERSTGAVQVAGAGGLIMVFAALDQGLKASGKTLADLTINSGPLSGALVANWPIVFSVAWLAWSLRRWYLDQRSRESARNARQDAAQALQGQQLHRIARSVDRLRESFVRTSDDHDRRLARCEGELDALLGEGSRVRRRGAPRTPAPD